MPSLFTRCVDAIIPTYGRSASLLRSKMPLTQEQIIEVDKLLADGLPTYQIAEQIGVPVANVNAIKAVKARHKNQAAAEEAEELDEALEQKFGLERDMQDALRANIHQLEPELRITDNGKEKKVASGFIEHHRRGQARHYGRN